jgi:hypothetical protein
MYFRMSKTVASKIRRPAFLAMGLAIALATAGASYAFTAAGEVTSTTKDALSETTASVNLSKVGGTPVVIASLSLPKGSWVVSSEETLVNFGPSDYTRCRIDANGSQIASGTTMVGNSALSGGQGPGTYVAGRGLVGSFVGTASETVTLECSHDHNTPSSEGPGYVDPGAVLWAHKSTNLSGTTR